MCTLTAFSFFGQTAEPSGLLRVSFNRDEMRTRPPGLPPKFHTIENRNTLYPIDPQGGGAWIALNDAGLVMAILNVNPGPHYIKEMIRLMPRMKSRGKIIPSLLQASTAEEALNLAKKIDLEQFFPFRLVFMDRNHHGFLRWDRTGVESGMEEWVKPIFYTSSGLGDSLVHEVREPLFQEMLANRTTSPEEFAGYQDQFHQLQIYKRPHLSICMERSDARTVSHTLIEIDGRQGVINYKDNAPCKKGVTVRSHMNLSIMESPESPGTNS